MEMFSLSCKSMLLWPDTHTDQFPCCPRTPWTLSGATGLNGEGSVYCGFWLVTCWYRKCPGSWWRRYVCIFFTAGSFCGFQFTLGMGNLALRLLSVGNPVLWGELCEWVCNNAQVTGSRSVALVFGDFSLQPMKACALL